MRWILLTFCAFACLPGSAWAACPKSACQSNADCPGGQTCITSPAGPCHNGCVAIQNPCTTDADCGPCGTCQGGACTQPYVEKCELDADCGAGATCVVDAADACKNVCQPKAAKACAFNADCPDCGLCISGKCMAPSQPPCTAKGGCGAGEVCKLDENDDPCYNTCVPGELDAGSAQDAQQAPADTASDGAGHAKPDAGGDTGAGAGAQTGDTAAEDQAPSAADAAISATPPAPSSAQASGCTSRRGPANPWALLLSLAFTATLALRRNAA